MRVRRWRLARRTLTLPLSVEPGAWLANRGDHHKSWRSLLAMTGAGLVALGALVTGGSTALGAPAEAPVVGNFNPVSVTFVSLNTGWALGGAPCARSDDCLALRETLDGGRTWLPRPLPVALVKAADRKVGAYPAFTLSQCCDVALNIRFADQRDGWIYGGLFVPGQLPSTVSIGPDLWSTHNGA